ncbi:MAG: antibiotic biosynthesis monooxygenase [Thiotrichales bacterium]|nr:antibiotic biosynthesis monooxygenase [Thiotrichales bacterium]
MSKHLYCLAQFLPKPGKEREVFRLLQALEPNTLREDGCLHYRVTRLVSNPNADGQSFPIVFNEVWRDEAAFNAHCQRQEIVRFFTEQCEAETGLVAKWNVCVYSDEPEDYDAPPMK